MTAALEPNMFTRAFILAYPLGIHAVTKATDHNL